MSLAVAAKLLQTALLLLTLSVANTSLPSSFRESAITVAKSAISQASSIVSQYTQNSEATKARAVSNPLLSNALQTKGVSSETSPSTSSRIASLAAVSASASSSSLRIVEPIAHEVLPIEQSTMNVRLTATTAGPLTIEILSGASVLQSESRSIPAGESVLTLLLSNAVRASRSGWLTLRITSSGGVVSQPFGLGLIFLAAGQSNAANSECLKCAPRDPQTISDLVVFLDDSNRQLADVWPSGTVKPWGELSFIQQAIRSPLSTNVANRSVWLPVGEKIAEAYHVPVAFIAVGMGASVVSNWSYVQNQSSWEQGLFPNLLYGKRFHPHAVLWQQGESDLINNTSQGAYEAWLTDLIQNTRAEIGLVPWYIAVGTYCRSVPATSLPQPNPISLAQMHLLDTAPLPYLIPGPNTDAIPHPCHFDEQNQFDAYAESWYQALRWGGALAPLSLPAASSPVVGVFGPSAGESVPQGSVLPISWASAKAPQNGFVNLYLRNMLSGPKEWVPIASEMPTTGQFHFTIPLWRDANGGYIPCTSAVCGTYEVIARLFTWTGSLLAEARSGVYSTTPAPVVPSGPALTITATPTSISQGHEEIVAWQSTNTVSGSTVTLAFQNTAYPDMQNFETGLPVNGSVAWATPLGYDASGNPVPCVAGAASGVCGTYRIVAKLVQPSGDTITAYSNTFTLRAYGR